MSGLIRTIVFCGVVVLAATLTACGHGNNGHIVDLRGRSGPNCYGCHSSNGLLTTYASGEAGTANRESTAPAAPAPRTAAVSVRRA